MKRFTIETLACVLCVVFLLMGCENPADNKPKAVVSDAKQIDPAAVDSKSGEAVQYNFTDESSVEFVGSKVTGSHSGGFNTIEGHFTVADGNPESSTLTVTVDVSSIWSDARRLTTHLMSADFLDVESFAKATFTSTGVTKNDDGTYTVTGNLDLHGITKAITFPASVTITDGQIEAHAEFSILRFDWGVSFAGRTDDLIRKEVVLTVNLKAQA